METHTKVPFSPSYALLRLEELKRWQKEKREELQQKQIKNREALSEEQRRMHEALSFDSPGTLQSAREKKNFDDKKIIEETNCRDTINQFDCSQNEPTMYIEGVNELESTDNESVNDENRNTNFLLSSKSIDEEIILPKKNFTDLLEEKLTDENSQPMQNAESKQFLKRGTNFSSAGTLVDEEVILPKKNFTELLEEKLTHENMQPVQNAKPKQKFLKRGEGLARFRMNKNGLGKKCTLQSSVTNKNSPQISNNRSNCSKKVVETNMNTQNKNIAIKKEQGKVQQKPKITIQNKNVILNQKGNGATKQYQSFESPKYDSAVQYKPTWSKVLSTDDNSAIKNKLTDKNVYKHVLENPDDSIPNLSLPNSNDSSLSLSNISPSTYEMLLNELRTRRDSEELKVFECLEAKAANSSFCSTSSTVQQLFDKSVISTPILEHFWNDNKVRNNFKPKSETYQKNISPKKLVRFSGIDEVESNSDIETDSSIDNSNNNVSFEHTALVHSENVDQKKTVNNFEDDCTWSDCTSLSSKNSSDTESELDSTLKEELSEKISSQCKSIEIQTSDCAIETNIEPNKDVVFKSELLKNRLKELENEIEIFRRENKNVCKLKQDFESEKRQFLKRKQEFEKNIAEEKVRMEFYLNEEKKKIMKEKMVNEKYVKDLKNHPNRKEREEISVLKQQVADLKAELKIKESRHGASQARLRNQIKSLEKEINNLKTEIDGLKKENKKLQSLQKRNGGISNTKVLHEINKNLSKILPHDKMLQANSKVSEGKQISGKTRNSVGNPRVIKIPSKAAVEPCPEETESDISEVSSDSDTEDEKRSIHSAALKSFYPKQNQTEHSYFPDSNTAVVNKENDSSFLNLSNKQDDWLDSQKIELEYEKMFGKNKTTEELISLDSSNSKDKIEKVLPDGTKEVCYPNGNIKKISPDAKNIKLFYYNGDVKETSVDSGLTKYFYAESKTWHTSYPDGLEILEFLNGQIEKRYQDGSIEINFPNGMWKIVNSDGTEELRLNDGTVITTNRLNEKIIKLTNGQREIHTAEHKRREYPDGTVKILFPDGITETRYANGRVRMKDKDGNLIMDSGGI